VKSNFLSVQAADLMTLPSITEAMFNAGLEAWIADCRW
jgi:hypothetical protein